MPQYRIDLADGLAYTFEESLKFYRKAYSREAVYDFWKQCDKAKASNAAESGTPIRATSCGTKEPAAKTASKRQGKKGTFAGRGVCRILSEDASANLVEEVGRFVMKLREGKKLKLQKGVERTVRSISELYNERSFPCPCLRELLGVSFNWNLSWVDLNSDDRWLSASFTVRTTAGPWRISLNRSGSVCAAFPLTSVDVGEETHVQSKPCLDCICCSVRPPALEKHILAKGDIDAERRRIDVLRLSLNEAQKEIRRLGDCESTSQTRPEATAWKALGTVVVDMPRLADAVKADPELRDLTAGRRLLGSFCTPDVVIVPVRSVKFSQRSISMVFRHGSPGADVETLVAQLLKGTVHPLRCDDLILEGVLYRGEIFSLDNRRLWALQQYQILLYASDVDVRIRVRLLPWSEAATASHFFKKFDSVCEGESVRCRGDVVPAGVASTVLQRVVLATASSRRSQAAQEAKAWSEQVPSRDLGTAVEEPAHDHDRPVAKDVKLTLKALQKKRKEGVQLSEKELRQLEQKEKQSKRDKERDKERNEHVRQGHPRWRFGGEDFDSLNAAKSRAREILRAFAGVKALPSAEFRILYDIIQRHPNRVRKRVAEVTRISVGTYEKFSGTPSFWIWRPDGTGEDISMRKCLPK